MIAVLGAAIAGTTLLRGARVPVGSLDAAVTPDMRLDINTATEIQLNALPGIGPALAARIATDREARGPFASVDDLTRVHGIGERIVERISPHIVCE